MSRALVVGVALLGAGCLQILYASATRGQPASDPTLLDHYCVSCHSARVKTAGLALDGMDLARVGVNAEVWEKVVRQLRSGVMPPPGSPRPDAPATHAFVSRLEAELDRASSVSPDPGRPPLHRLNRAEYANAVRDLLGVEFDAGIAVSG